MVAFPPSSFFGTAQGIPPNPGDLASNYMQGWNIPAGNFTTSPQVNYLMDLVNAQGNFLAGPWQVYNGGQPLLSGTDIGLFGGFGGPSNGITGGFNGFGPTLTGAAPGGVNFFA